MSSIEKKSNVLVVGELNMDLILDGLEKLPQLEKEIFASGMSLTLGSSSAIFASNLAILGMNVSFVGKIGKDQFGEQILKYLSYKGVNVDRITYSSTSKTGFTTALNYKNQRAMVTYPGAMLELSINDLCEEDLTSFHHLHVSSIFLQPTLKEKIVQLFRSAKIRGLTTSLDPQWEPKEEWDCDWENLLPLVDIFLPNLEELKNITKKNDERTCINQIKDFSNIIVIKNGEKGSTGWDRQLIYKQPAFLNWWPIDLIYRSYCTWTSISHFSNYFIIAGNYHFIISFIFKRKSFYQRVGWNCTCNNRYPLPNLPK